MEKEIEAASIVGRLIAEASRPDMEAWELAVLEASLTAGAKVLGTMLGRIGSGRREHPVLCTCGGRMHSVGLRTKQVTTMLGKVPYARSLFVCPQCDATRVPGDELLDIVGTGFSPGTRRLMTRAGSRASFIDAEDDLLAYAHVKAGRRDIERIAESIGRQVESWIPTFYNQPVRDTTPIPIMYISFDGTGCPMRRGELKGRKGKQPDGSAKGREVKLGCIFTQTHVDKDGYPVRDENTTSYVGGIESSHLFGMRIYDEAVFRGVQRARIVVVLTDGAAYNKTIVQTNFPGAIHIIDLYHAREHLKTLANLLFPQTPEQYTVWKNLLDAGDVERIISAAHNALPTRGCRRKNALKEISYIEKNASHMRYALFRSMNLFVGSGVIEAGCRTIVGKRLKQSGMFWSLRGAHAIIQLRCCMLSRRFVDFWEDRAA